MKNHPLLILRYTPFHTALPLLLIPPFRMLGMDWNQDFRFDDRREFRQIVFRCAGGVQGGWVLGVRVTDTVELQPIDPLQQSIKIGGLSVAAGAD